MKKTIKTAVFALAFGLLLTGGAQPVYAESMTVPVQTVSDDNSLSSLQVAQAELDPEFDPDQLTYTVTVPYETTRIAVTADTASPQAQKVINGTGDLDVGENTVTILVTAQNGEVREYRITVIRQEEGEAGEPGGETPGETAQTEPEQTEDGQTEPQQSESGQAGGEQSSGAGQQPETESSAQERPQIQPSLEETPGMVIATSGEAASEGEGSSDGISSGNFFILVLGIFCLVMLFVIIAALLLRRDSGRSGKDDDGDEDEDRLDGGVSWDSDTQDESGPKENRTDGAGLASGEDEDIEDIEGIEDIEIVDLDDADESLEDDEDFDLLDF